jgi:hypothetical protein
VAKIIRFPRPTRPTFTGLPPSSKEPQAPTSGPAWLHVLFILAWPVLRWVFALDVLVQLVRMLGHWGGESPWPEFRFALHFVAYVAATYFVAHYRKP